MTSWWRNNPAYPLSSTHPLDVMAQASDPQQAYQQARAAWCEQWRQSDAEDWCARKELQPGTYEQMDV